MARILKRHFLQQAKKATLSKVDYSWFMSEKLDGQRAFWDGGFTRDMPVSIIPWANTAKDKKEFYSTGLWSRYGKPIFAPNWFLDCLPKHPLDGELWSGRGKHQFTRSAVSKHIPDDNQWRQVSFCLFDTPNLSSIFYDSVIDIPNYYIDLYNVKQFVMDHGGLWNHHNYTFAERYRELLLYLITLNDLVDVDEMPVIQVIPNHPILSKENLESKLSDILANNGEGIVLRNPNAMYRPERNNDILKIKPYQDDEATVVGYITGRATDKGSKLLGMMGAMIVDWNGKRFELSGFTDEERTLIESPISFPYEYEAREDAFNWAYANPETICPNNIIAEHFPRGSRVTFKYRELTDAGIPKEASYMRTRGDFE